MEHIDTGLVHLDHMGSEFRMVISSGEKLISITKKQFTFLKRFLETGNIDESAGAVGVKRSTVLSWFRNPRFRQFLKERLQYAADRNGCTFDWAVSELKNLWEGKKAKTKVQMEAMKEINRMLGHIKEFQGGINAREFINAEYVVIQKNGVGARPESAQIPSARGSIESQVYLPDVRAPVGQINPGSLEGSRGNKPTVVNGVVSEQPIETGQGYDLGEDAPNIGAVSESF